MDHLLIPDKEGNLTREDNPAKIEKKLLQRNTTHFSQADGTPFTTNSILKEFGKFGSTTTCEHFIDGRDSTEWRNISEATKSILNNLKQVTPEDSVNTNIEADDLYYRYKAWQESTSTSPSGLHLGHAKAIIKGENKAPDTTRHTNTDNTPLLSSRVFTIKSDLINLAIDNNYIFQRWRNVTTTVIEKDPGQPKLERLRVIHLIESDFNLVVGIQWGRCLMHHYEDHNVYTDDPFGSRKNRATHDILVFKHLWLNTIRLTQIPAALSEYDAKSCYDGIVMLLAMLVSRRNGMSKAITIFLLKAFLNMKYHIKTKHGISDRYYHKKSYNTWTRTRRLSLAHPASGSKFAASYYYAYGKSHRECE